MVLQTSGPISLSNVATEFNDTAPHKLTEFYSVAVGIPTSGLIKLSHFYGVSNNPDPPTWSTAANLGIVTNSTAYSKTVSAYSDSDVTLTSVSIPFGTFSVNGNTATLSGTTPNVNKTTYTWTLRATDQELQTTDRAFTMIVSKVPTISTASLLGSFATGSSFGISLSASSDSSVTFSMESNPFGFGTVSSGGYFSGTAKSPAGTYYWYIRATDQEGQYTSKYFQMSTFTPIAASWNTNSFDINSPYNGAYIYLGSAQAGGYVYYTMYSYTNGTDPKYFTAQYLTSLTVDYYTGATYGYMPYNPGSRVYWLMTVSNAWGSQTVTVVADLY